MRLSSHPAKLLLSLLLLSTSCSTAGADFEAAQRRDRIVDYEEFLRKHPDSAYSERARGRLQTLRDRWEAAERSRIEPLRQDFARVEAYRAGGQSEAAFLSDGWDARAPYFGRLGIVGFERIGDVTIYHLGIANLANPSGIVGLRERRAEIAQSDFEERVNEPSARWVQPPYAKFLCKLIFEEGTLADRDCDDGRARLEGR